ncbi:DUF350 domain-containing protein [Rhizobium sp. BR 249]|uniref:DUF350 domain-containing protein n=1 Tax=Rhizobium sp. BR 249 TaxID=3040011 RepID=UPI0039BF4A42
MDFRGLAVDDIVRAPAFILLYLGLILTAKWFKALAVSYKLDEELARNDNLAVGLSMSGYYLATAAIYVAALYGPAGGLVHDLVVVGGYSLLGIGLLNLARWFSDRAVLRKFDDTHQLVNEKNIGVGAVHCGAYIATGLVIAGSISGEGGGLLSVIVFFVLGQLSLLLFTLVYERLLPYDIHEALRGRNVASGVAFAGHLVALAIIIMNASAGNFVDWGKDLTEFFIADVAAFIFLPILRLVMDRMTIRGQSLGGEIRLDANVGAGLLEATMAVCFAVVLAFLI